MKKYALHILLALFVSLLTYSCNCSKKGNVVVIKNTTPFNRNAETVEVNKSELIVEDESEFLRIGIVDAESKKPLLRQFIDKNGDGVMDAIIFQPDVKANAEKLYKIEAVDYPEDESKVFSRFVPERTDDYTWENDKVAFRTFGPYAQQMIEQGIPGGTLTSGIDCWLKKVDYPIINRWYKKHTSGAGSYHEDTGEGLDNFHVGLSRGCGGLGVYINDTLFVSKNFIAYETLSNGPIRTEFTLDYADWWAGNFQISEQKLIRLDLGSDFMHITAEVTGTDTISVGLTLHENDGITDVDDAAGWISYWEPQGDSELGTGIIVLPKYFAGYTKVESLEKDNSQLLVHLKVIDNKVEYLAGFGWKERGEFISQSDWEKHLAKQALLLQNPLEIHVEP